MNRRRGDQLAAVESRITLFDVRLDDLQVRAPFAGRVVTRHAEPGEWLIPGNPVVTLVSSGQIEAWLAVPERYTARVATDTSGLQIRVEGNDSQHPVQAVKSVGDVDDQSRLFPVVATLDDQNGTLVPGMAVHADLPLGELESHLAVPVNAVINTRAGSFVYRVKAPDDEPSQPSSPSQPPALPPIDSSNATASATSPSEALPRMPTADQVMIDVLFQRDGLVFIRSDGLKTGDQVVVEGNERMMPGNPLIIGPPPSSSAPKESPPVNAPSKDAAPSDVSKAYPEAGPDPASAIAWQTGKTELPSRGDGSARQTIVQRCYSIPGLAQVDIDFVKHTSETLHAELQLSVVPGLWAQFLTAFS